MDHRRSRLIGPLLLLLLEVVDEPLEELPIEGTQLGLGKTEALCGIGPSGRGCICFCLGIRNR